MTNHNNDTLDDIQVVKASNEQLSITCMYIHKFRVIRMTSYE